MSENRSPIYSSLASDEDLQELVVMFVDEMSERVARFQQGLETQDWDDLRVAAHQLKGSAGSHGFAQISPVAADVEDAIKSGQPEEAVAEATRKLIDYCLRATAEPEGN